MTLSELKKMIEDEVSALAPAPAAMVSDNSIVREPQKKKVKAPYRTALNNEEEIDDALFYGGKKPQDE